MRRIMESIKKEDVAKVNKLLENEKPSSAVAVVETFVALLRAKPNTKPVDVQMYFEDYSKLVAKMGRVETTQCSLQLVESALATVE